MLPFSFLENFVHPVRFNKRLKFFGLYSWGEYSPNPNAGIWLVDFYLSINMIAPMTWKLISDSIQTFSVYYIQFLIGHGSHLVGF